MNRRDFAKGFAALPLLGAAKSFGSICGSAKCPDGKNVLQVIFRGPFAVVMNSANPWGITAFTPKHDGAHMFSFNGVPYGKDSKFKFELPTDNLVTATKMPCVDNPFPPFCADNVKNYDTSTEKHFITVSLPCPQRIYVHASFPPLIATMNDSKQTQITMPGDRILEYEILDTTIKIEMSGQQDNMGAVSLPPEGTPPAFTFEVGLPTLLGGNSSDPNGSKGVEFYNRALLPYFSDLAATPSRNLLRIDDLVESDQRISALRGQQKREQIKQKESKHKHKVPGNEYIDTVGTYECKSGGLTVTSP
jgi:hypothetical protein